MVGVNLWFPVQVSAVGNGDAHGSLFAVGVVLSVWVY